MRKPLRTEEEAERELLDAVRWYEERHAGLGAAFLSAVDTALDQVDRFPRAGAPVPRIPEDLPVRRAPIVGFPYHVIYLETTDAIRIVAFAHDSRRPGYWLARRHG